MKTKKLLLGVAAIAFGLTASAHAQNIQVSITGLTPGVTGISTSYNGGAFESQDAGVLQFNFGQAFCVEPTIPLNYPDTLVYSITDISNLASNDIIAKLVGGYLASNQSNENAAAVQLAIWEVVLDGPLGNSLSSGNLKIQDPSGLNLISLAETYLTKARNGDYAAVPITYLVNTGEGAEHLQNIVTWSTVPEPSSMLLLGLTSLAFLRRKR